MLYITKFCGAENGMLGLHMLGTYSMMLYILWMCNFNIKMQQHFRINFIIYFLNHSPHLSFLWQGKQLCVYKQSWLLYYMVSRHFSNFKSSFHLKPFALQSVRDTQTYSLGTPTTER